MSESIQFKESVRGIVEYVLKGGSLDDRFVSRGRALEGTIAHGKLQRDNEKVYQDYEKEVILKHEFLVNNISLIVEGRADGIIKENGKIIIEEIKSTYKDLSYINFDYNLLHWAQGKFYGYIYCVDNNIDEIDISKIKAMVNNRETRRKERKYENLVNPIDIDSYKRNNINYDFDEIDDKNYDINQILEKKRSGRNYEESPRVRKISDTNYNILKSLDFEAKEDEEEMCTDFLTQEKNIKSLLNTIAKTKPINEATDLFANLRSDESNKEEKKEEDDKAFYTSITKFDEDDFGDDEDIPKKKNSKVFVIIIVVTLLIAIGFFVWYKFFK